MTSKVLVGKELSEDWTPEMIDFMVRHRPFGMTEKEALEALNKAKAEAQ